VGGDPVNFNDPAGRAQCWVDHYDNLIGTWNAHLNCASAGSTIVEDITISTNEPQTGDPNHQNENLADQANKTLGQAIDQREWDITYGALQATAAQIADMAFSSDCADSLQKLTSTAGISMVSQVSSATRYASFANGFTTQNNQARTEITNGAYAAVFNGTDPIYWRPGSEQTVGNLSKFGQVAWLGGAVMHEVLHTMGYDDAALYSAFGLISEQILQPTNTNAITEYLAGNCFR
jgi:hypothetical protein